MVVVPAGSTPCGSLLLLPLKLLSPLYVAVMVNGLPVVVENVAVHEAVPSFCRGTLSHSVVLPWVKVTVPVGCVGCVPLRPLLPLSFLDPKPCCATVAVNRTG